MRTLLFALFMVACTCPQQPTLANLPDNGQTRDQRLRPDGALTRDGLPGTGPAPAARAPAVDRANPLWERVEGEGFKNACTDDAACQVGGCSQEVCSAEEGIMTTCEVLEWPHKGARCGCVAGECAWYR